MRNRPRLALYAIDLVKLGGIVLLLLGASIIVKMMFAKEESYMLPDGTIYQSPPVDPSGVVDMVRVWVRRYCQTGR